MFEQQFLKLANNIKKSILRKNIFLVAQIFFSVAFLSKILAMNINEVPNLFKLLFIRRKMYQIFPLITTCIKYLHHYLETWRQHIFEMASMPFPCNSPLGVALVFLNVLSIFWLFVLSLISICIYLLFTILCLCLFGV